MRKVLIPALLLVTQLFAAEKTKLFDLKTMQDKQNGTLSDYKNSYATANAKDFGFSKQTYDFECLTGGKNGILTINLKQPLGDFTMNYEIKKTHEPASWVTLIDENNQEFDIGHDVNHKGVWVGFGEYKYGGDGSTAFVSIKRIGDETSLYLDGKPAKTLIMGIGKITKIELSQECNLDPKKRDQFDSFVLIKN